LFGLLPLRWQPGLPICPLNCTSLEPPLTLWLITLMQSSERLLDCSIKTATAPSARASSVR